MKGCRGVLQGKAKPDDEIQTNTHTHTHTRKVVHTITQPLSAGDLGFRSLRESEQLQMTNQHLPPTLCCMWKVHE